MVALETRTTEGSLMADMTPGNPRGVLRAADVAELWTVERRKRDPDAPAYKATTVLSYLKESTPAADGKPHRYVARPMPAPAGRIGVVPWWRTSQRRELIDWWRNRPGHGHGTGGPRAGSKRRAAETPEPTEAEFHALAADIEQTVAAVHERLAGGELERRRDEIMGRVRDRQAEA